jgi:membrane-associated protease RseP (regulator of RpoE activity)
MATTFGAFLLVITILVFVHELGHYLMARWCGVRVVTFSIGFGPRILSVRVGGTDYCLSAIPFGGYVNMATGTAGHAAADEFLSKALWQRMLIFAAGPLMNIVLAVGAITAILLVHGIAVPAGTAAGTPTTVWLTPFQAVAAGVQTTVQLASSVVGAIGGLLSGGVSPGQLVGPVGIAQLAGDSARAGWFDLIALMALISVNLGVLNLMPLPVLDGGHIVMMALERVRGRDFTLMTKQRILRAGLVLLLLTTAASFYNDISRLTHTVDTRIADASGASLP